MRQINPNLLKLAQLTYNPELKVDKRILEEKAEEISSLENLTDFWRIPNVSYRNGIYTVDLAKELLDNRNAKTQEQWVEYSKQAKQNNNFYTGDMPLHHAVFTALSKNNGKDAQEAMNFVKEQMRAKWLMTLTRLRYNPKGKDDAINNYGMDDEYAIETKLVGADEWIKDSKNIDYLKAILGNNNVNEINQVYQRINGTEARIWRLNSKPENIDERVAGFVAGSGGVGLGCCRDPGGSYSSLGVRPTQKI